MAAHCCLNLHYPITGRVKQLVIGLLMIQAFTLGIIYIFLLFFFFVPKTGFLVHLWDKVTVSELINLHYCWPSEDIIQSLLPLSLPQGFILFSLLMFRLWYNFPRVFGLLFCFLAVSFNCYEDIHIYSHGKVETALLKSPSSRGIRFEFRYWLFHLLIL